MKIKQLNKREKLMAGVIISIVLLSGYGYLRFEPRLSGIDRLTAQKDGTLNRIATLEIPEEPLESMEQLKLELDDLEKALQAIEENSQQIEAQLAPVDSQELKLRISELARDSGIAIKINEVFRVDPITPSQNSNREADKQNNKEILPPFELNWVKKLAPNSMFHRPLQRVVIDADYTSLRRFIHGLDNLPYRVTVVRINIEKLDYAPLRGMSQLLKTELVLAL